MLAICCGSGHPARKDTRLWFGAPVEFVDCLKPRKCDKDSAVGYCDHKRQHKIHLCSATGGKGSRRGLQGSSRHRVPPKLVDDILAALFPKKLSLEQLMQPIRRQYSEEEILLEIKREMTPQVCPSPATAAVCAPCRNKDTGAEASDGSVEATGRNDGTFVI